MHTDGRRGAGGSTARAAALYPWADPPRSSLQQLLEYALGPVLLRDLRDEDDRVDDEPDQASDTQACRGAGALEVDQLLGLGGTVNVAVQATGEELKPVVPLISHAANLRRGRSLDVVVRL